MSQGPRGRVRDPPWPSDDHLRLALGPYSPYGRPKTRIRTPSRSQRPRETPHPACQFARASNMLTNAKVGVSELEKGPRGGRKPLQQQGKGRSTHRRRGKDGRGAAFQEPSAELTLYERPRSAAQGAPGVPPGARCGGECTNATKVENNRRRSISRSRRPMVALKISNEII